MAGFGCAAYQRNFRAARFYTNLICFPPQTVQSHITDPYKCIQGTKKLSNEDWKARRIRTCSHLGRRRGAIASSLQAQVVPCDTVLLAHSRNNQVPDPASIMASATLAPSVAPTACRGGLRGADGISRDTGMAAHLERGICAVTRACA